MMFIDYPKFICVHVIFSKFITYLSLINCTLCVCVCFQDDNDQLTVVTDRSQGGGSIYNGSLEIMVRHTLSG